MAILDILARLFIASMFFYAAVTGLQEYPKRKSMMEAKQIPYTEYALPAAIGVKILGALSILFNIVPAFGAFLLILFMGATTYYFADFWNQQGEERKNTLNIFTANLSIIGGLLLLITR